jgi:hypothetical protein
MAQRRVITALLLLMVISTTGCSSHRIRTNLNRLRGTPAPRTIQILASSSIGGRPMGDDSTLRDRVAKAFQEQFPGIRSNESEPDMVVFFTMVDYVPDCLPNCKKFKTYLNWTCEVEIFAVQSGSKTETFVFNLDESTYNPLHNPAVNCASELTKTFRGLNSIPSS